jgi:hypothetical protein
MKQYVKTEGPVPSYLTAGKVYECDNCVEGFGGHMMTDKGYETFIVYPQSEHIGGRDWILCDAEGNPVAPKGGVLCYADGTVAKQRVAHEVEAKMGELSLVALERDRWKAIAGELAGALRVAVRVAEFEHHPARPWHYEARSALAQYEQEKGA